MIQKIKNLLKELDVNYTLEKDEKESTILVDNSYNFCLEIDKNNDEGYIHFHMDIHPNFSAILMDTFAREGLNINVDEPFYVNQDHEVIFGDKAEEEARHEIRQHFKNEMEITEYFHNLEEDECYHC